MIANAKLQDQNTKKIKGSKMTIDQTSKGNICIFALNTNYMLVGNYLCTNKTHVQAQPGTNIQAIIGMKKLN